MEIKKSYNCKLEFELDGPVYYIFSYMAKKTGKTTEEVMAEVLNEFDIAFMELCDNEEEFSEFIGVYSEYIDVKMGIVKRGRMDT